ncbi:MAG TPA: hypothetical protein VK737_00065 [Opitutales bacterium]|jgi:hypothetical protein|nr:hypothetical protein [Opitutales bacterium]
MIVLISKRLPPTRCGIGDYTRGLAMALAARGEIVAGLAWENPGDPPPADAVFPIKYLAAESTSALLNILQEFSQIAKAPVDVILQTSQYDVHPQALAGWLTRGLAQAQSSGFVRQWVMMMHEIWLPHMARRREVLRYPWQRASFARLLNTAGAVATPTTTYAKRIERLAPNSHPKVLPVFSNFDEPDTTDALEAPRENSTWTIFGSAIRLRAGLESLLDDAGKNDLRSQIQKLEVFGGERDAGVEAILNRNPPIPHNYQPAISAEQAGECLRKCHAAWIDYREAHVDAALLGKSGILAAALANGVLPVLAHPATGFAAEGDALPCWYSVSNPPPLADSPAAQSARAKNLEWYHHRASRKVHAAWYAGALRTAIAKK